LVQKSEISGHIQVGRAAFAATIGNMLEFYDFITYSFFAIQIGHTFFPSQSEFSSLMLSLATFGAGFVTRPIGGIVLGIYSDRVGRRPAMLLSFALMGAAILTLSLTPSYDRIGLAAPIVVIVARMVQGFALGGEVGPTTAYLIEIASPERRALMVSWQPTSQQIAATTGALVGVILSKTMPAEALDAYGWRIAFLIGAACLPFGLWMRRTLPETIPLHKNETGKPSESVGHLATARRHARLITPALLILASGTIATYVTQYMTTYARTTLQVAPTLAFATTMVSNGLGIAGALLGGLAGGPVRPQAGDDLAAACHTGVDLSHLPVDRSFARRAFTARRLWDAVADWLAAVQRVLRRLRRRPASKHPRRGLCHHLCGRDRELRRHRAIGGRLADPCFGKCIGAGVVSPVRGARRIDRHEPVSRNGPRNRRAYSGQGEPSGIHVATTTATAMMT
jgi:MFS family permease